MPHQILKFRSLVDPKELLLTGHKDAIILDDFKEVLNLEIIEKFHESERHNLVVPFGYCEPDGTKTSRFIGQNIVPIDVDHIDNSMKEDVFTTICAALCLDPAKVGCIDTGNGIHILIRVTEWTDAKYFDNARPAYVSMCSMLQSILANNALQGEIDANIWAKGRTTRLVGSINDKTHLGRGRTQVRLISGGLEVSSDFDLMSFQSLETIRENAENANGGIDQASVLECPFLVHCKTSASTLSEPEWVAMLGILAFLKEGDSLCHEYSKPHPTYTQEGTDKKILNALKMSGPRTCKNISTLFSGCASCKFQSGQRSPTTPLQIRGESFIATEKTGFCKIINGKRIAVVEDMEKYIKKIITFKVDSTSGLVYSYDRQEKYWKEYPNAQNNFSSLSKTLFYPEQTVATMTEVAKRLMLSNKETNSFVVEQMEKSQLEGFVGRINLKNGVYNFKTGTLEPHDKKNNFMYCLDFDYDPNAVCPTFDHMCETMFTDHPEYTKILLEFLGLGLSGIPSRAFEKCLVLLGSGSNGKSTLCKVFESLAGAKNCTSHTITRLKTDAGLELRGKIFNLVRETPTNDFDDPEFFKNLISGEPIYMHKMYVQKFSESTNTKHLLCCNTLPSIRDKKHGFSRRLIIMKLTKTFSKTSGEFDRNIEDKLHAERSGIFNKAIDGVQRLLRQDDFTPSLAVEKTLSDFKKESDTVAMWFDDCCELTQDPRGWPTTTTAYKNYTNWCVENGHKYTVSHITFHRNLQENISPKIEKWRTSINGVGVRKFTHFHLVQQFQNGF